MPLGAYAANVATVDTDKQYPPGTQIVIDQKDASDEGESVYIYAFNDSGTTIPVGDICVRKAATATYNILTAPAAALVPAMRIVGVCEVEIVTGSYGWLLRSGVTSIQQGANVTADSSITVSKAGGSTAGQGVDMASGDEEGVIGLWLASSTATPGTLVAAWVDCRG